MLRPLPNPHDDELAGLRRAGFDIGPQLGSGATSAVYAVSRAADLPHARPLALKVLHAEHTGNLELVLRFLNEAHIAKRVCHPGVLSVYDSGVQAGRPYLLIERLTDSLMQRAPLLSLAQRVSVVAQIAAAAAALHHVGVVHRDLKPANVMFAPSAELCAKLVDLGLAKLTTDTPHLPISTAATEVLGTAEYRAPELWVSAKDADGSADVYALGVMFYELLAGRLPFRAERESVLMELHLFAAPPPLPAPPAVSALLTRMLAKSRAQRPTMAQVAEFLHK